MHTKELFDLSGRVAIVTGGGSGLGRQMATALAEMGADVVLCARNAERCAQTAAELSALGVRALGLRCDVTSADDVRAMVERATADLGRIDILVNNAAITKDGLAMRMKPQDWDAVLAVNLTGAFVASQQVLLGMMRERWGRIINITSVVAEAGNAGQANYVASKAGLIGLTKSLAQEMASRNVTVNAVAPGFIDTDMTQTLAPEFKERILAAIPLQRLGRPEDVAAAVRFLASDEASYITGHVLNVNGGMYM
jgi:3-oxoacyl-[acyl-carrier protein] reductase